MDNESTTSPLRVRLLDEPPMVACGLAGLLADEASILLVPAETPDRLVDLTLVDSFRPGRPLSEGSRRLAELVARGRVAVFTWHPNPALGSWATAHGAVGCVAKDLGADRMAEELRALGAGDVLPDPGLPGRPDLLAPREHQVLWLIASGLSNHEVADELSLSINSIKSYVRTIYRKIGVTTRTQAVLWALENGIGRLMAPPSADLEAGLAADGAPALRPTPVPRRVLQPA